MNNNKKSTIYLRLNKTTANIYRRRYNKKTELIGAFSYNQFSDFRRAFPHVLANRKERIRWEKICVDIENEIKHQTISAILNQDPGRAMLNIYDTIQFLVEEDPNCLKKENQQIAANLWLTWSLIRPVISSKSSWGMQEQHAKKTARISGSASEPILQYLRDQYP